MNGSDIARLIIIIIAIILIALTMGYFLVLKGTSHLMAFFFIVLTLFIYVLIFNLLEPQLEKHLVINEDMKIFDYIWYAILILLILFLNAAFIHSIYISSDLIAYFLSISVGISMILFTYTILYKVFQNRQNLGKIVFIMTIYVILLTGIIVFLNRFVPAHVLRIFYILYACFVFGYVCCVVILIGMFIYNLIVNPFEFENIFSNFNVFGKLNAGTFQILSI